MRRGRGPRLRIFAPAALCAGLLATAPGIAAPSPSDIQHAADQFDRAMTLWQEGDKTLALQGFREAHALVPTDATLWNVIVVERELGLSADAHRDLDTYLRKFDTRITSARLKEAVELRRELEGKLARVHVSTDALGVSVWIDGAPSETDTWVTPGQHLIRAEAPGRKPAEKTVTFEVGEHEPVELRLPAGPPPPDPVQRNLGFGLIAIGGAGLLSGGALAVKSINTNDTKSKSGSSAQGYEGVDYLRASQVTLTMGALALAIGAHLVLTSSWARPAPAAPAAPAPNSSVSVVAAPLPGGAVGVLSGTF